MPDNNAASNSRVTLALLKRDLDSIQGTLDQFVQETREYRRVYDERLRLLDRWQSKAEEQIGQVKKDVDGLNVKSNRLDLITFGTAVISGIIGSLLGPRQ